MTDLLLYFLTFAFAVFITAASLPYLRKCLASRLADAPTALKNHQGIIPAVGGCAVALGFFASLTFIRLITAFPTGTLKNLRGLFIGGAIIFAAGLIDDIKKPAGLPPFVKLSFQFLAAVILINYDIRIQFAQQPWGDILTVLWICGLTNALNLIDIMDGLAVSQAALGAATFAIISLPSEYIYVNFAAATLLGTCIGFWPYNHSKKLKTFLGDSGSNLLGFLLAALALGTSYSATNPLAVFVPLIILALPIFDTIFVSIARISKGISPLRGSPDHFPLRIERLGFTRNQILILCICAALVYDALAYFIIKNGLLISVIIYALVFLDLLIFAAFLMRSEK
ncbi:MAG: undecaprenyl/decaprenyl-phosphate alpha-N-acetylglucosaminyl 1-phosphate transferase [Elusimicrobiota bacterium]|nr:undecaprenyl/decaprenyl-phosphate alpha-N-acetylglucosaminyl 1-phosphate transferase [Elusimicrobiota bacterium]